MHRFVLVLSWAALVLSAAFLPTFGVVSLAALVLAVEAFRLGGRPRVPSEWVPAALAIPLGLLGGAWWVTFMIIAAQGDRLEEINPSPLGVELLVGLGLSLALGAWLLVRYAERLRSTGHAATRPLITRPVRRLSLVLALALIGSVVGTLAWSATRPTPLPLSLVVGGTFNYVQGNAGDTAGMRTGCHTRQQIAAQGFGPIREIGYIGAADQMPRNAFVSWGDARPVVDAPGWLPVLGSFPGRPYSTTLGATPAFRTDT